ncbi:lysM and putative peptidoglycan-binding domain-containing protein 4 [Chironomus tepperi]|uniref:lysM and putative peptidoglycan-binding domain-containing protein 4 n=1 Tax=Chironomus tepperi TaxID=113505 RepID=UPI00391F3330
MLRTKKDSFDLSTDDIGLMKISDSQRQLKIRHEQTLEAEVLENDTIHSIAIRNNCSVSDIKKLNKIHQDNEIHAFKTIKVPLSAHNILVDTLPRTHKSGNNSPKAASSKTILPSREKLEEKLLLASVSNAVIKNSDFVEKSSDLDDVNHAENEMLSEPLLKDTRFRGYPKSIKLPKNEFLTFNGSDCELSWVFLLIVILAFCVIIPLIYVYAIYEHPEHFNHSHSKYDDPELHFRSHIDLNKSGTHP